MSTPPPLVALAGNPNTGKTTLFNRLTGARAKVGNYPGVTVETVEGKARLGSGGTARILDVPGAYSLSARSAEEQVAIRAVAGLPPFEAPDAVVVVVDATQLTRNLYLCLQIIELGLPVVVALTMVDAVERKGQRVDVDALARELGVRVVPVVAHRGDGTDELRAAIDALLADPSSGRPGWRWRPDDALLERDLAVVREHVPDAWLAGDDGRRDAFALWALLSIDEGDELDDVPDDLRTAVASRHALARASGRDVDREVIGGRYGWIDARAAHFFTDTTAEMSRSDRVDRVLLHPVAGFALFLALMTVLFQSLFAWADPMITAIEEAFSWIGEHAGALLPAGTFHDLVVDGLIGGVGGVLVFLPQILLLFLFIGIMEDTGYMARVAFLMDRIMKSLGLHGRAFVPMLSGFACAIPAVLATRTMERKRDRLLTMMVVPLMTCSARLPVYSLLIAAMIPAGAEGRPFTQGLLLVAMYLFSTLVALACAAVLGRTVLKGPRVPLLLELPPYRLPHPPSVLRMMWQKSSLFVKEAGTVILACTIGMWALLYFPREPELDRDYATLRAEATAELAGDPLDERLAALDDEERGERLRKSIGGRIGSALEPTLQPLGFDWKIGVGILGAFAAREVFVSTMAVVYGLSDEEDEESPALRERLAGETRADGSRVYTPLVCFSLMVFFALACQCLSTVAVVKRETHGYRWPLFLLAYMTALAWVASFVVYQGGRLFGFE